MRSAAPLRVLTLTNMYPTAGRPTLGTFVAEEVDSLRDQGVAVDVLFVDGPGSKLNYLRGARDLHRHLASSARQPYHLIHAHYVFCGVLALTQRRLPVVVTQHGIETQTGWTAPLSRWVSRRTAHTIATSARVAQALGAPRTSVLPCGVDVTLFHPMPRSEARAVLGLPAAAPLVLYVGARRAEKRLPLIEAAFAELRRMLPDALLVMVHDEPRARIPIYMNACDVLVLASVAEGSPVVVREALACDLPVVATDVGDVPALIEGVRGCYIAEANAVALASQLNRSLCERGRADGRERIVRHSRQAVAAEIEHVYRSVLATWNTAAGMMSV